MIPGDLVRLRPIERDDLPRYVRWFADPEVRRHLEVAVPFSLAQEERWYEDLQEQIARQETMVWAIETGDGVHIGSVGLHNIHWQDRSAELGILIGEKTYWDRGYGADAVRTLLRLGFEEMNLHRIYLRVDDDNLRAIRCYEKCEFKEEGKMRDATFREGRYHHQHLMSILRPEFQFEERA